ncbi:MAG: trypsin-like serine protease [Candidatus Methanosuratincola petrocarbonis]
MRVMGFEIQKGTLIAGAFTAAVLLSLAFAGNVLSITNGTYDGEEHPYVGLAVFDTASGPTWRCSCSLLSPTVVLTAGHCTDGAVAARVWFAPNMTREANAEYPNGGATSYEGVPYTYPGYSFGGGKGLPAAVSGDVGIIVLTEPVPTDVVSEYASLPNPYAVDELSSKEPVDLVGYGVQYQDPGGGVPPRNTWKGLRLRMYAPAELVSGKFVHSDEFVRVTANPGGGTGGVAFGDSGGLVLLGGTDTVIAVNSYVTNVNCGGVTYSYRIDTGPVLTWIYGFLN